MANRRVFTEADNFDDSQEIYDLNNMRDDEEDYGNDLDDMDGN